MASIVYQDDAGNMRELSPSLVHLSGLPEGTEKRHRIFQMILRPEVEGLEKAIKAVTDVVDGRITKPVLIYSSSKGVGKTHLAHGAGWMMLNAGKTVAFYYVADLLDALKEGYNVSQNYRPEQLVGSVHRTYEQVMAWAQNVHLLILDDVGVQKLTDWSMEKLDQIVDYRYARNKPLIMTANSLDFSDRIVDRCKEGAIVRLKGPSYRGTEK